MFNDLHVTFFFLHCRTASGINRIVFFLFLILPIWTLIWSVLFFFHLITVFNFYFLFLLISLSIFNRNHSQLDIVDFAINFCIIYSIFVHPNSFWKNISFWIEGEFFCFCFCSMLWKRSIFMRFEWYAAWNQRKKRERTHFFFVSLTAA